MNKKSAFWKWVAKVAAKVRKDTRLSDVSLDDNLPNEWYKDMYRSRRWPR